MLERDCLCACDVFSQFSIPKHHVDMPASLPLPILDEADPANLIITTLKVPGDAVKDMMVLLTKNDRISIIESEFMFRSRGGDV